MKTYHFSVGNSTQGPVGFCAEVLAKTRREAAQKLRRALYASTAEADQNGFRRHGNNIEYLAVYFNPACITAADARELRTEVPPK